MEYFSDLKVNANDIEASALLIGNYEECHFNACSFTKCDFSRFNFIDCIFNNCDLSLIKTIDTGFQNCIFTDCKLVGVHFDKCKPFLFSVNFTNSIVDLSSFYKVNLSKSKFKNSSFKESDFTEANMTKVNLEDCKLENAIFFKTDLRSTNFTTAFSFTINPEVNLIKGAKLSSDGALGLLQHLEIVIN